MIDLKNFPKFLVGSLIKVKFLCVWEELGASELLPPVCFYTNQHSVYFLRRPLDQLICALDTDVLLNTKLTVTVYANLFIWY